MIQLPSINFVLFLSFKITLFIIVLNSSKQICPSPFKSISFIIFLQTLSLTLPLYSPKIYFNSLQEIIPFLSLSNKSKAIFKFFSVNNFSLSIEALTNSSNSIKPLLSVSIVFIKHSSELLILLT